MALTKSQKDALAFKLIGDIVSASPNEVVRVLSENGFSEQFPYGTNGDKAQILLQSLYIGNPQKFAELVRKMNIDLSRINPQNRESYKELVSKSNPNAKITDWLGGVLDTLTPKTIEGGGETITEETTTGAYIAYIFIVIAIIGITIYLFRTIK